MPARTDLTALIEDGWGVVPIRPGTKHPYTEGWQDRIFTADDFGPMDNVGVKCGAPSSHRIDVDCDAVLAVRAAALLLPTTRTHGRTSKPKSHYWYHVEGAPPKRTKFHGLDGKMLVEFRADGEQTVVPPSTHPTGEPLAWTQPLIAVRTLEMDDAIGRVTDVAITALLASIWPGEGGRHAAAGAVGGYLAQRQFSTDRIVAILLAICELTGDDAHDRVAFAKTSAEKVRAGGHAVKGIGGLRELMADAAALLEQWLGSDADRLVESYNEKYFVVEVGGDVVVGESTNATTAEEPVRLRSFENFRRLFPGKAGEGWLQHPARRQYRRLVFAPPGAPPPHQDDYNIWRGFAVSPAPGDVAPYISRYLAHVRDVIADGDEYRAEYVLDLLADCVQRPGQPPGKALALRGPQGVGKSLFVDTFGSLFGPHYISVSSRDRLVGKFNAHLSGKIVVFADEAVWGGNKSDVGTLKHMTTQSTITIERKGVDLAVEPNCIHLFLATNEGWTWPAGNQERRGVIYDVIRQQPRSYFVDLVQEIQAPTFRPALLAYLLARPVDYARLAQRVDTAALREQQTLSASPVQQWWEQVLHDGDVDDSDEWPDRVAVSALYDAYVEQTTPTRRNIVTRLEFRRELQAFLPTQAHRRARAWIRGEYPGATRQSRVMWCFYLPPLADCRAAFDRVTGTTHTWPVDDDAEIEGAMPYEEAV